MQQLRDGFSVGHVVEPTTYERRLVIRARQLDAGKGETVRIRRGSLELALWPEVTVEIGVADVMSPQRKLTAEIDLERVSRIIVYEDLQSAPILATSKTPI